MFAQLSYGGLQELSVTIPKRDGGSGFEETRGDGQADTLRTSSDDSMAMIEIDPIHSSPVQEKRITKL